MEYLLFSAVDGVLNLLRKKVGWFVKSFCFNLSALCSLNEIVYDEIGKARFPFFLGPIKAYFVTYKPSDGSVFHIRFKIEFWTMCPRSH